MKHWNTLELVKKLLNKYMIVNVEDDIAVVLSEYETVMAQFEEGDDIVKAREAKRRLPAIAGLMRSCHVINLFQSQATVSAVRSNVLERAHRDIELESSCSSSSVNQPSSKRREPYQLRRKAEKKTKVSAPAFQDLGPEEALELIIESGDCKNGVLDFTKPISKKFKSAIPLIISYCKFNLTAAITLEERRILIDLNLCCTGEDEEKLLNSLFKKSNLSENIKYLRTAINGLFDIWQSKRLNDSNDEGWLRSNLYSFIWDRAFLFDDTFYVKRAECYSAVIRKLKENNEEVAQQRVDFILRSNHDGTDYLTLKEKPTDQEASNDFNKGKRMQRHMLKLWSNWLGSRALVSELEAVSCQWQERKLTVFGTRMLPSGRFIVYRKATAHISSTAGHYSSAARLFQIILSVKRLVTLNHMKLTAMIDTIERYSNDNLDLSINTDQPYITFYRNNSTESESSSEEEEEEPLYLKAALSSAKAVKHPDEIVSTGDWEKMFIDDVNVNNNN
ncbi:hypothetical protein HPULCUR_006099 [Helicostylum pulchrum]|uniref:Uncharacterized protein n=1 Tax=Helicostylum pulchrum TaxID=562976 RepID=A0ABP9Y261_9FUNG